MKNPVTNIEVGKYYEHPKLEIVLKVTDVHQYQNQDLRVFVFVVITSTTDLYDPGDVASGFDNHHVHFLIPRPEMETPLWQLLNG